MASLENGTWYENHVGWHFPPSACVHVTHCTWHMTNESYEDTCHVRGSFLSLGSHQGKINLVEEKEKRRKKKRKGRKEIKGAKTKERRKEKKRALIPSVPTI